MAALGGMSATMPRIVRRGRGHRAPALAAAGVAPLMANIFAARGVATAADLDTSLTGLPDWRSLADIEKAAGIIADAVRSGGRIVVLSDYDADGATACAVMVRGLRGMGANVGFVVPQRMIHGYGLTRDIVPQILSSAPALVITVDNGISSIGGIADLKEAGVPVVVTDHHLAPEVLPDAVAIVNPNRPGDSFPSKAIAGCGVAFYVVAAVRSVLEEGNWFASRPRPVLSELLPIVALGTIADVVPLDYCNRILVANGLQRIRSGRAQAGIYALARAAGRNPAALTTQDLAFYLGPRLNAAGRIDDMSIGVHCLLEDDPVMATAIAERLEDLNVERRAVQAEVESEALRIAEGIQSGGAHAICVAGEWHAGVVGVVAGRLKETCRLPVIVFSADGGVLMKGSGRSLPGYHLRDALARIDAAHPGLIDRFGGHAMAAGLSVAHSRFEDFRAAFMNDALVHVDPAAFSADIESDGELPDGNLSLAMAEEITSGVWGQAFPEPVFDGVFDVVATSVVGARHRKLTLSRADGQVAAIWFGAADEDVGRQARFAYRLGVNEWRGEKSVQAVIVGVEKSFQEKT